jgi:hypothetical protein
MRATLRLWLGLCTVAVALGAAMPALGQSTPMEGNELDDLIPAAAPAQAVSTTTGAEARLETSLAAPSVQELLAFKDSDVKFDLRDLMDVLSDRRHEGWVLAAYPDPKTSQPLIGAGMSLDLPAREHPQRDPLNPHPFLEPSSAELWQAAGLDRARLQSILEQFNRNLAAWKKKRYRKKIATLSPQITDDEANQLLRIAAIHAIYNAKAYCRNFDRFSASQQMAVSQLVYQMGVNLEEFSQFLNLINSDAAAGPEQGTAANAEADYWKAVQASLIQSQWARLYRVRAASVIAMLDPQYAGAPAQAERKISATLRPAGLRRRRGHAAPARQNAAYNKRASNGGRKKKAHLRGN